MIEIKEVKNKRDLKKFVDFPTKLYNKNEYYVHPIRFDEISMFKKGKNPFTASCDFACFLAYMNGKIVGRIAAILQHDYNKKTGEKRIRFSRFDSVNNEEVAKALFGAVEQWGRDLGMEKVHGPLGFNDLDREGLLIEGFDQLSTFEEQYNFDYYPKLLESAGYIKEVDWLEYKLLKPESPDQKIIKLADSLMKKNGWKYGSANNKREYIEKYKQGVLDVIEEAYGPLYGTVPFNEEQKEQIIKQFGLFFNMKLFVVVTDENDKVLGFGFGFPSLSKAVQKSKGRILPFGIFRLLKAIKKPVVADLALIGVRPDYLVKGVAAVVMKFFMETMCKENLKYVETNLNLEDNAQIQNLWKYFEHVNHKKRRAYIKNLEGANSD